MGLFAHSCVFGSLCVPSLELALSSPRSLCIRVPLFSVRCMEQGAGQCCRAGRLLWEACSDCPRAKAAVWHRAELELLLPFPEHREAAPAGALEACLQLALRLTLHELLALGCPVLGSSVGCVASIFQGPYVPRSADCRHPPLGLTSWDPVVLVCPCGGIVPLALGEETIETGADLAVSWASNGTH